MKKYTLPVAAIAIIALIAAGAVFYINKGKGDSKPTEQAVAELLGQKYNRSADSVIIQVGTDTGTFAKGSVRFEGENGGGLWFAAKTAKGWELAFDGNGIVTCDAVNKYNFPKDLVPQCIDAQHNNNLIQR